MTGVNILKNVAPVYLFEVDQYFIYLYKLRPLKKAYLKVQNNTLYMLLKIRQEEPKDYNKVAKIIENAFKTEHFSDHQEQFLVERLRNSKDFIPELSMVAEIDGEVVGQILLSKIKITNSATSFDSLALAPVSVAPDFQKQGIGGELIRSAHKKARELRIQIYFIIRARYLLSEVRL